MHIGFWWGKPDGKRLIMKTKRRSRDSLAAMTMDYGLDGRFSIPDWGKKFVSTPQSPDWL
jgi:hypothetical protein